MNYQSICLLYIFLLIKKKEKKKTEKKETLLRLIDFFFGKNTIFILLEKEIYIYIFRLL